MWNKICENKVTYSIHGVKKKVLSISPGFNLYCMFVLRFYDPVNIIKVMSSRLANQSTLFLGRLPKRLTSTKCPYFFFLPIHLNLHVTDNCPIWIGGRERLAVEIISWPKFLRTEWWTSDLLNTSRTAHPTDLAGSCFQSTRNLNWLDKT